MANSRREFIKKSAMVVVAAGIPIEVSKVVFARSGNGSAGVAVPAESLNDPLMYLRRSSFEPYVNSIFQVSANHSAINFNLIQVSSRSSDARSLKTRRVATTVVHDKESEEQFALLFRSTDTIQQDVYQMKHAALGQFRILLVPVANRDTRAYYYEVVINRAR